MVVAVAFYPILAWSCKRPVRETLYRTLPQMIAAAACIAFILIAYSDTPQIRAIVRTPGPADLLRNLFWFWGRQLTTAHWLPESLRLNVPAPWELAVGALFLFACILLALRLAGSALLWTAWALLFTLPFLTADMGDNASGPSRYLYLASAGIAPTLAVGLHSLMKRIPEKTVPFMVSGVLALLVASSFWALKEAEAISFYQSGRSYIARGDFGTGARQFESAVARNPRRVPADGYFRLAAASFSRGVSPDSFLQKVRPHIANTGRLDVLLRMSAFLQDDPQNWARAEREILEAASGDAFLLTQIARAYFNLGSYYQHSEKLDRAVDLYHRALRLYPDYAMALKSLGAALHDRGQLDGAIQAFEKSLRLQPDDQELIALLAGDEVRTRLADALYNEGKTEAAIRAYENVIQHRPDHVPILKKLAHIYYNRGEREKALKLYRNIVRMVPNQSEAYRRLAQIYNALGQKNEERSAYQRVVNINPDDADAWKGLGNLHYQRGRIDDAIAAYQQVVRLRPEDPSALNNLGYLLSKTEQYARAAPLYRQSIGLAPQNPKTYLGLGLALEKLGEIQQAIAVYRDLLALDPKNTAALARLRNHLSNRKETP